MSLKAFHIFFITASIALGAFFTFWCFGEYRMSDSTGYLITGIVSFFATVGLGAYLVWAIKKLRNYSYLGIAFLMMFGSRVVEACPTCVGDPNSVMAKSANMGVMVLLGLVSTVLAAFGGLFIYWIRRSEKLGI